MPQITEMYAYVAEEIPGEEGVVGMRMGDAWFPLVGADMARAESLRHIAVAISKKTAKPIRLVRFGMREDLGEVAS